MDGMKLTYEIFYDEKSARDFYDSIDGWRHFEARRGYYVVWYYEPGKPEEGVIAYY